MAALFNVGWVISGLHHAKTMRMPNQSGHLAGDRPLELVIFVGLQASGKTTFYRNYFESTHRMISKDLMRNAKHKSARQERMLNLELSQGHSVVLDNTNPTLSSRSKVIEIAHRYNAKVIGYYFTPNVTENLRRNRFRQGRACVPDVAIYSTAKKIEKPSYDEGFDELWEVSFGLDFQSIRLKRSA